MLSTSTGRANFSPQQQPPRSRIMARSKNLWLSSQKKISINLAIECYEVLQVC